MRSGEINTETRSNASSSEIKTDTTSSPPLIVVDAPLPPPPTLDLALVEEEVNLEGGLEEDVVLTAVCFVDFADGEFDFGDEIDRADDNDDDVLLFDVGLDDDDVEDADFGGEEEEEGGLRRSLTLLSLTLSSLEK